MDSAAMKRCSCGYLPLPDATHCPKCGKRIESDAAYTARDVLPTKRDPLDWYIEVCAVCGCQLGPGIGARTRTGRCVYEEHRSKGGVVVRVTALPASEQQGAVVTYQTLERIGRG